jgi:hypothetical protein
MSADEPGWTGQRATEPAGMDIATGFLAGAGLLGAALVAWSITRLLRVLRESILARLPVVAEQDVRFAAQGPVVLCIEQPHFSMPFTGVGFAMRDDYGHEVPSTPIVFRSKVSGFSRVRLAVRTFDVPRAGRYRLIASGIAAGRDMSDAALVFARPFVGAMVLCILGIVFGGMALIAGIVLTALRLAGKI